MRNERVLDQHQRNLDNLIHALSIQLDDLTDDQLDKLINIATFEKMDREKDLRELKDIKNDD